LNQLRKVLKAETIRWSGSKLTLDYLEARARAINEALQVKELERAPLEPAKAAATKSLGQLHLKDDGKVQNTSAGSSKRPTEERRRRNRGNKKREAFAVTAAPANSKPGFMGKCYICGQEGHVKDDCPQKPKDGATSGRKPGAVCNFCHKRVSHMDDECWEKHPDPKPKKWWKKDGGSAKQAYTAGPEPSALEAEPAWEPYMAWSVSVQPGGGARDAFAIFTEERPELRATTQEQRDTTPAAMAKGKTARTPARAKEEKRRVGGPPSRFKPKGEGMAPTAEDVGQPGPAGIDDGPQRQPLQRPPRQPGFPQGLKNTAPTTPGTRASSTLSK
jgi:hypothetical protein